MPQRVLFNTVTKSVLVSSIATSFFDNQRYIGLRYTNMISPKLDCVFIETTTACTRECPWCTHRYYDIKPNFMSEHLFLKTISELQKIDFNGRLSFYLNGEPLLDKRLSKWVTIGKNSCPKSFTFIITNGDLLTYERILELLNAGLDAIKVNTYDDETFTKVNEAIQKLPRPLQRHLLHFDYSKKTDWSSGGGIIPIAKKRDDVKMNKTVCLRPFMQMYISCNGLVAQCCTDTLNRYIMGDITKQPLLEIWNGEPFTKVRNGLIGKGELQDMCKVCDLERTYQTVDDLRQLFWNR